VTAAAVVATTTVMAATVVAAVMVSSAIVMVSVMRNMPAGIADVGTVFEVCGKKTPPGPEHVEEHSDDQCDGHQHDEIRRRRHLFGARQAA